jgi:hypothetical protein
MNLSENSATFRDHALERVPFKWNGLEMRSYLRLKRAPTEALTAVPILWRRYAQWLAQTRRRAEARKALAAEGPPRKPSKIEGTSRR